MNYRVQIAQDFPKKIMNNHIKQIIFFGSVARGDDNENSDICLLIIADNEELVEDEISDEIMDILLYKKERISAHIISENHYNKTKIFHF